MEPGELFYDKYRVAGIIGAGGQSSVYRAEEVSSGRQVAIKLLEDDADGVRFIREGRVVSRLDSPNIVELIEFGRTPDGPFFMVFEFVDGENLEVMLKRRGPITWKQAAPILRQTLEALAEAHKLNIVHRDVKPANIMLEPNGWVKMLDFGVARLTDSGRALTKTGTVLGTPRYVAPEGLRGEEVTVAADVYAVGLLAYELLVGKPANRAEGGPDIVLRHLDEIPYRIPREVELPRDAKLWIEALCKKRAEHRPENAIVALAELAEFEPDTPPTSLEETTDENERAAMSAAMGDSVPGAMSMPDDYGTTTDQEMVAPIHVEDTQKNQFDFLSPADQTEKNVASYLPDGTPIVQEAPPQMVSAGIPQQMPSRGVPQQMASPGIPQQMASRGLPAAAPAKMRAVPNKQAQPKWPFVVIGLLVLVIVALVALQFVPA